MIRSALFVASTVFFCGPTLAGDALCDRAGTAQKRILCHCATENGGQARPGSKPGAIEWSRAGRGAVGAMQACMKARGLS